MVLIQQALPWKAGHPPLPDNAECAKASLGGLLKKLTGKPEVLKQYHGIIQEQINQGIVEYAADEHEEDHVFYMPHKPVIRELAETTKMRIVYEASARENQKSPSLNDFLHVGPPLQPLLHDVLLRNRLKPIALTADMKQAFHQIWIDKKDRDAFRFYWISDFDTQRIITLRLTRAPFGSALSPFILGGTLGEHFDSQQKEYPETIAELKKSVYVDDVISGGASEKQLVKFKSESIEIFKKGNFSLHKWHSTIPALEDDVQPTGMQTYAKEILGTAPTETKMLGLLWNKAKDMLAVSFKDCKSTKEMTKRGMLRAMAKVFDPIGLVSPVMLIAKHLYRETCETKHTWDGPLQKEIELQWMRWLKSLASEITLPRSITCVHEKVTGMHNITWIWRC